MSDFIFTSESVTEGHPDKIADQISDSIIDHYLAFDDKSKVACETLVTKNQVILAGEVKSSSILDHEKITKLIWKGKGLHEKAYLEKKVPIIEIKKEYFRPAEVDTLKGDASKARKFLKWKPSKNINYLIKDMVEYELNQTYED